MGHGVGAQHRTRSFHTQEVHDMSFAFRRWLHGQEGQNLVEYAVIVALIAFVAAPVLTRMGHQISAIYFRMAYILQAILR